MNRTALACTSIASLAIIAGAALISSRVTAGPLDPPSGAVASTYKTLTEVEPRIAINATNTPGDADSLYRITQPGAYYLTRSVAGIINKSGIEVAASGVSIDLNGFELVGATGTITTYGIFASVSGLQGVEVRNGTVRDWGGIGVNLSTNVVSSGRVTGVRALDNVGIGMSVHSRFIIDDCTASGNGDGGFSAINECVFTGCVAANNDGLGFNAVNGPAFSHCTAYGNGAGGFACGNNARVLACTSNSNDTWGISSGVGGLVADCVVASNTTNGIVADSNAIVLRNTCEGNGSGAGSGAGIYAWSDARIEGNHCTGNDRGIEVVGSRTRVDGNSCTGNGVSFDIGGSDNIVIRNTATGGSPNYLIGAGNSVAPRVSVADSDGW
ncbi:MAG: right-handed parallel beta-helix repeat-containing protein, partial [Phycisphaerae bacterium]|nr:right-handed parallel beta-helix repeat-containing protein [Phycisphaerae bacterium]